MALHATHLTPRIGTRVDIDLHTLLSGALAAELRQLLQERGVLVIRGLQLDDEQQLAFTRTLGPIGDRDAGTIYKVTFDKRENPAYADYNYGNFSWHIDRTDTDVPPFASILNAKRLAPWGGQTEFANTYAAYEDLPPDEQQRLEGLKVLHKVESSYRESIPHPTAEQLAIWRKHPDKVHPLVWRHRSGRKSLALSTSATQILGMAKQDSDELLARLMQWATQPQYVYVHEWQVGDLVIWDNTGTMHRVRRYDVNAGRLMHRSVVLGDEPFDSEHVPAGGR